jgi:hypothetical protein
MRDGVCCSPHNQKIVACSHARKHRARDARVRGVIPARIGVARNLNDGRSCRSCRPTRVALGSEDERRGRRHAGHPDLHGRRASVRRDLCRADRCRHGGRSASQRDVVGRAVGGDINLLPVAE